MTYMCMNCGQDECFNATQAYREWGVEDVVLDGEGSVIDYGDRETTDSETTDGPEELSCTTCAGEHLEWYDTEAEKQDLLIEIKGVTIIKKRKSGKEIIGEDTK